VWDTWHVDLLTRILWPCILAEKNLPAFVHKCSAIYRICTTRRDQERMRQMPVLKAISKLVAIEFIDTPTEDPEPIFHMHWFSQGVKEAREQGAIFFNLWPDVIFTDRTLASAADAIADGRAGCVIPTLGGE
jgi:hypothetical protein